MQEVQAQKKFIKIMCCYEIESASEFSAEKQDQNQDKGPMLTRTQNSNIVTELLPQKFANQIQSNSQPIYELINDLYDQSSSKIEIYRVLSRKRVNPSLTGEQERDDIEYYIPQLVTYLVIERSLADEKLVELILDGCGTDFYFAHRVYFYLKSLSINHIGEEIKNVYQFIENFVQRMRIYETCKLSGVQFTKSMVRQSSQIAPRSKCVQNQKSFQHTGTNSGVVDNQPGKLVSTSQEIQRHELKYGTLFYPDPLPVQPPPAEIYKTRYCSNGFMETPTFWDDLIEIGAKITTIAPQARNSALSQMIKKQINPRLPSNVYIPFFKDRARLYTVLCVWKGRIFSTKERAPYSVWLQIYREQEQSELESPQSIQQVVQPSEKQKKKKNLLQSIYEKISRPFSISDNRNTLNIKRKIANKLSVIDQSVKKTRERFRSFTQQDRRVSFSQIYESFSEDRSASDHSSQKSDHGEDLLESRAASSNDYFPAKSVDFIEETKRTSVYRNLKSWKLVHLMVKTGDDIKQQQFAMQLINRFQYIFKKEKVGCLVFPYQVISLGPDCGLIEMVNDITTLDKLFEKLSAKKMTLKDFFDSNFPNKQQAKKNFMRSLAGYSLLTYFLQIKDRHNGNILLHRDGYIIHIDFGFFLSNSPGKGVQLQKKVPFKLLTQYVQVIGSLNSEQFFQFRRLFYKGFIALTKNRQSILSLVRIMFGSHGQIMGCFIRGQSALFQLQKRLSVEQNIESFCYDLISNSLDNWRARWYDKFQYFLQKIYY